MQWFDHFALILQCQWSGKPRQYCGVMKFGRHALLSRGWGSQDKHRIMPLSLKSVGDWG
jgi:hypothetical protein